MLSQALNVAIEHERRRDELRKSRSASEHVESIRAAVDALRSSMHDPVTRACVRVAVEHYDLEASVRDVLASLLEEEKQSARR